MAFDIGCLKVAFEGRVVDQEGLVLKRGIGQPVEGRDVMFGDAQGRKGT